MNIAYDNKLVIFTIGVFGRRGSVSDLFHQDLKVVTFKRKKEKKKKKRMKMKWILLIENENARMMMTLTQAVKFRHEEEDRLLEQRLFGMSIQSCS